MFHKKRLISLLCLVYLALGSRGVASETPPEELLDFLEIHCTDCHDDSRKKGELDLESLFDHPLTDHNHIWEKAILRLDTRQMPPATEDRPSEEEYQEMVALLSKHFDELPPQPIRGETIRRLTRTEYSNAIRDLLAIEVDVTELLPKDDASHGFDNVTVSTLSPTLINRYLSAAQKISRLAVGIPPKSPEGRIVRLAPDRTQEAHVPGLPLGTRGGTLIEHNFPTTGDYEFTLRLTRDRDESVEGLHEPHDIQILIDGTLAKSFTIKKVKGRDHSQVDTHLHCRIPIKAGAREVGVTFAQKPPTLSSNKRQPYDAAYNRHRHPRQSPALYQVGITGPHDDSTPGETASRTRIFGDRTDLPADESVGSPDAVGAARQVLKPLIRKAYRRPVTEEDLAKPLTFFKEASTQGDFDSGIEAAISAILVSPRFLLRIEDDPADLAPNTAYALDDFTLASRLSFFLWSSLPDDQLLDLAEQGKLSDPATLKKETQRMLADPRAQSLVDNFAAQWLHLPNLASFKPDLRLFPDFDDNLREAMGTETKLLFASILNEDRSILDLLRADFTHLNERLAKHYEIPGIYGSQFRRVKLSPEHHRGGILRQASILAITSYANRTSPVLRGNWVLENILGTPAPAPPPDVPALNNNIVSSKLPIRERLAQHSSKPSCSVCHVLMDPIGFSLEHYDAIGRWRQFDAERPVDALGGLPDGREFQGIEPLIAGLLERPDLFARTATEKLLIYALGRGLEPSDQPSIRTIVRKAAGSEYAISDLVTGIVLSTQFRMSMTRP